jgi:guanine deaminase
VSPNRLFPVGLCGWDALFEVASKFNMRVQAGKICMDRNAPNALLDSPQRAYDESAALAAPA